MTAVAALIPGACLGCGGCLLTCPEHAIRPAPPRLATPLIILAGRCSGCGDCVEICPAEAIEMTGAAR